jgi:hypothetical protein
MPTDAQRRNLASAHHAEVAQHEATILWQAAEISKHLDKIAQLEARLAEAHKALHDAATSMHTISTLAGFHRTDAGNTFMGTFPDVRAYARSRSNVAREAINAYYLQPHVKAAHEALRAAITSTQEKA